MPTLVGENTRKGVLSHYNSHAAAHERRKNKKHLITQ